MTGASPEIILSLKMKGFALVIKKTSELMECVWVMECGARWLLLAFFKVKKHHKNLVHIFSCFSPC